MSDKQKNIILGLRIALGLLFLYAGISKVVDPTWTAAGFLKGAKTFHWLYAWFGSPMNIGWVNFVNEWGLTLLGICLITGLFIPYASWVGIAFMLLYFFPTFHFPFAGEHSVLVDEHIIYILVLLLFIATDAGLFSGLDSILFGKQKPAKKE